MPTTLLPDPHAGDKPMGWTVQPKGGPSAVQSLRLWRVGCQFVDAVTIAQ